MLLKFKLEAERFKKYLQETPSVPQPSEDFLKVIRLFNILYTGYVTEEVLSVSLEDWQWLEEVLSQWYETEERNELPEEGGVWAELRASAGNADIFERFGRALYNAPNKPLSEDFFL